MMFKNAWASLIALILKMSSYAVAYFLGGSRAKAKARLQDKEKALEILNRTRERDAVDRMREYDDAGWRD